MTEPTSFGPSLSIVVPCFNEESRIVASLSELVSWFDERAEILAVDDGSGDRTFELVQRLGEAHPNVRAYRLPHNHGKGGAARAGLAMARGARVVLLDADLAFDRASVRAVVDALDGSEMAIGNRRHDASRYTVPVRLFGFLYLRHLVGLAFNAFVRGMLQIGFRDTQCGLKGFRREALRQILPSLTTNGFALDVEILLVARALPLHIVEVPVMVTY